MPTCTCGGLAPGEATPADFQTRLARARGQARDLLNAGFTTVRDLGSPITPSLRDANAANPPTTPRILAAHVGLTGARGPWLIPQPSWWEAARMLGVDEDVGTLEAGKFADLIAVRGDPRRDLSVLQRVEFVMRGGQVVRSSPGADGR